MFSTQNPFSPANEFAFTGLVAQSCHFDVTACSEARWLDNTIKQAVVVFIVVVVIVVVVIVIAVVVDHKRWAQGRTCCANDSDPASTQLPLLDRVSPPPPLIVTHLPTIQVPVCCLLSPSINFAKASSHFSLQPNLPLPTHLQLCNVLD